MQLFDGDLVLSPTDLTGFVACRHLTEVELAAARGQLRRPERDDPLLDVLTRRGGEHEQAYLERLRDEANTVVEIAFPESTPHALARAEAATVEAMRGGADVVYQATFFDGRWRGHADFLVRVAEPSPVFGAWSYEAVDTKLARRVKAAAIVQLCAYSDQVARLQGSVPRHLHVVGGDGVRHAYRVADFAAYHRALRARFEGHLAGPRAATYPERVAHCAICRWDAECAGRRRADDHLVLVAGMRNDQAVKLQVAGVATRGALAQLSGPVAVDGIAAPAMDRLRAQAALQVRGAGVVPPLFELVEPPRDADGLVDWAGRGLAALPPPSPGDLFFDMEGDQFALDGGLEYLFGVVEVADGATTFHPFWAHDRAAERVAFERFVDFVEERRRADPTLHVYHYAPYEPNALKRLMGAHGTREQELDSWLRGGLFVDLYAVVRHAVRLSTESYGLKAVESSYLPPRDGAVVDAGGSVVAYEDYLMRGDPARLTEIAHYNEADCASLVQLQTWLEARRAEAEIRFGPVPRRVDDGDGAPSPRLVEREEEAAAIAARLVAGHESDPERLLLAALLSWHRRESKPEWWAHFERRAYAEASDYVDDRDCLGGLELVGPIASAGKATTYRYRFDVQDHKVRAGDKPEDPRTGLMAGTVVAVDDLVGTIDLSRSGRVDERPHPRALIPAAPVPTGVLEDSVRELGGWVAEHGLDGSGPWRAARDLLARRAPRLGRGSSESGRPLAQLDESTLHAARRIAVDLDHSYLAIQGPPGSGKTYTGAHVVLDLVRAGKRVGITGPSHAVIGNLLAAVCERAAAEGEAVAALQKCDEDQWCGHSSVAWTSDNAAVADAIAEGTVDVVAGTAWLWARAELRESVDVLVVDEAAQKSLADVLAMSRAARSLVLLGDPQQLAQPSKGSHPHGAEVSALAHVLDGAATMPADRGLFLETTHRMHPDICAFVSEIAYESRLHAEPGLDQQSVAGESGVRFQPVEHTGNRVASGAEADRVAKLVEELVGAPSVDRDGRTRPLAIADVLVVAPYNAHVARLRRALPDGVRVGTVDKFQGQEAPVVVYSMATSSPEDVPRGLEFLYDLNRLNVAVSRARSLVFLVCSPALLHVVCRTPEQMRLVNALCRYVEHSGAAAS